MDKARDTGWAARTDLAAPEDTSRLARAMRFHLGAGDVLLLAGPIGAGKSHFARALIGGLLADHGRLEDIPSPTYTLVQSYEAGPLEIWHADLYRLTGPGEAAELGLFDAFSQALCLVEWPERLEGQAPADALTLEFSFGTEPGLRHLRASSPATRWRWLEPVLSTAGAADG